MSRNFRSFGTSSGAMRTTVLPTTTTYKQVVAPNVIGPNRWLLVMEQGKIENGVANEETVCHK